MLPVTGTTRIALAVLLVSLACGCAQSHRTSWDARSAASYLDQRETWWAGSSVAVRDEHTFCISCHTALPYALARPVLSWDLRESAPAAAEIQLLNNVSKRVRDWRTIPPYYPSKARTSRGTEAVLNALILASRDARKGHLSAEARLALGYMWAEQSMTGADAGSWPWIQFNNEPWEAKDSPYYGAVLAAMAVGLAPDHYRSSPEIQRSLDRLRSYLQRAYAAQTPIRHFALLSVSVQLPGLISPAQSRAIMGEIETTQRPDGGWCLAALVGPWKRRDGTAQVMRSDGYATGLAVLALQQAGDSPEDPHLRRGLAWLATNQEGDGYWRGYSLNKRRSRLLDGAARFMDDAATAYAVLGLTYGSRHNLSTPDRELRTISSAAPAPAS